METQSPGTPPVKRPSWLQFILYLVVGIGLFALGSLALGELVAVDSPYLLPLLGLVSLLTLGGTAVLLGTILPSPISLADWGIRPWRWEWLWLPISIGISALFLPLRAGIGVAAELLINGNLDSLTTRSELLTPTAATWSGFLLTFLGVAVLVPVAEELFFRGLLHTWLQKRLDRFWPRALISAGLFGAAHYDSLGVALSSFVLGLIAAYVYERTRSLLTPILIHMTTNGAAVILMYAAIALQQLLPQLAA